MDSRSSVDHEATSCTTLRAPRYTAHTRLDQVPRALTAPRRTTATCIDNGIGPTLSSASVLSRASRPWLVAVRGRGGRKGAASASVPSASNCRAEPVHLFSPCRGVSWPTLTKCLVSPRSILDLITCIIQTDIAFVSPHPPRETARQATGWRSHAGSHRPVSGFYR